ncbi:MAG: hypothetical protein U1C53_00365 [Candidatus Veblenbacteria bacterium]|nr:hypothetical protein [Candidatus Veblenbacteria bacterium]MDZ4229574.1 hypothetical protein [Candidatus Veblenbacteria bacterium]
MKKELIKVGLIIVSLAITGTLAFQAPFFFIVFAINVAIGIAFLLKPKESV